MASSRRHALIVGASRGLGLGLVETFLGRGWAVTATQRKPGSALSRLSNEALAVETADIDDDAGVAALHERLAGQRFELIFVVAGVATQAHDPVHTVSRDVAGQVYQTNAVSPILFAERFLDTLAPGGSVAFMSSILGSVGLNTEGGWDTYRASKAALNTYARTFEHRHREQNLSVLLVHPGWVKTDMGGEEADIDVATSVTGTAEAVERALGKPGIAYFDYTGETLAW